MNDIYSQTLKQYWGYDDFRGIQRQIIESIGAGQDTLGLMPTGGGKSVTFQVPALIKEGTCIVITPLIALMKDQVLHLRNKSIRAASLHAGMTHEQIVTTLDNCILGDYKFLYISPERLESELFQNKLRHMKVSFICVDEAHCISQWGYDFRPSYLQIKRIRKMLPEAPVLALTASATKEVIEDIQKQLEFKRECVFRMSFERKNLSYNILQTRDKQNALEELLKKTTGSTIIYTRNRRQCWELCKHITETGLTATFYHAGLSNQEKELRQTLWQEDKVRIMIATNAFGMGIDKPDVRQVIHLEIPDSIESYYQEAGRAGRDGKPADSYLLYAHEDIGTLRKRISETYPEKEYIRTVYEHICFYYQIAEGFGRGMRKEFNINEFCHNFKHFPVQAHNALTLLTKCGYLEYTDAEESISRLMFILTRDELYKLNEQEKTADQVIRVLLRKYTGLFIDYAYIDENLIASQTGLTSLEVYNTLVELSKRRIISYIPKKNIPHISFPVSREKKEKLIIPPTVYEDRKAEYAKRINAIINFVEADQTCRNTTILAYFGEQTTASCGQCDVCLRKHATPMSKEEIESIKQEIANQLTTLALPERNFTPTPKDLMPFNIHVKGIPKEKLADIIQLMVNDEEIIPSSFGTIHLTPRGQKKYRIPTSSV